MMYISMYDEASPNNIHQQRLTEDNIYSAYNKVVIFNTFSGVYEWLLAMMRNIPAGVDWMGTRPYV